MLDKPTLIVSTAFFLSGGLIVFGLGYPSYASWRDSSAHIDTTPVAQEIPAPIVVSAPAASPQQVPQSGDVRRWEREDEDEDDDDRRTTPVAVSPTPTSVPLPSAPLPTGTAVVLSASEIAKHANASSCWMSINGKVYDMTAHVNSHSGGAQEILSSCGRDGTVVFNTKGGEGRHSASASSILTNFYIGDLNGPKIK